jgi:hypothetical protein
VEENRRLRTQNFLIEKNILERDIGIHELDAAINKSKKKGSPGIDGFNYTFIKKYWNLLRVPLHKYTLAVLEKGNSQTI